MRNPLELGSDVREKLALELEGKLFVEITIRHVMGEYWCCMHHYTVLNGKVYECGNGLLRTSGDTLLSVVSDCTEIGVYVAGTVYTNTRTEYSYAKIKKVLKL